MEIGAHARLVPTIVLKRTLVATDFSQFSAVALQYAGSLAPPLRRKVVLTYLQSWSRLRFILPGGDALSRAIDLAWKDTLGL